MRTREILCYPAAIVLLAGTAQSLLAGAPFTATLELSSLDGTNGFVINGIDAGDRSGVSVSSAGDVNGDGVDDLIIGAPNADPNGVSDAGESYVVFGGAGVGSSGAVELSALDGNSGFVLNGNNSSDNSGRAVSAAGDVNGDGVDDLIIGAYRANTGGNGQAGESYVVFGGAGLGASGAVDLSGLDGSSGFVINGIDTDDFSGWSVSSAGDVNGDGEDDLVIGAIYADPNGTTSGESYVVFGGAAVGSSGAVELSALDGTNGYVINGLDSRDRSGNSVSGAGDANGDGVDDLIIGAPYADPSYAGQSYLILGSAGVGSSGAIEVPTLNGSNGFVLNGVDADDQSGRSVSSAGDINGDGVDDVLIGAPGSAYGSGDGKSYVVFGSAGVGGAGAVELSALDGTNGFVLGLDDKENSSGYSVSGAGDVNGDGVDDLIIGANGGAPNGNDEAGASYVVFGGPGVGSDGAFDLSALNGTNGFVCNGIDQNDDSGVSVSMAGDVNGDGVGDLIIGAYGADPNGNSSAGESYVVFGRCAIAADLNGDDVVDTADLGMLIGQIGTAGPGADINGDGVVDPADLGILIGVFGVSCP